MTYITPSSFLSPIMLLFNSYICFFFFNDTATTEIYTLSLHDALPISSACARAPAGWRRPCRRAGSRSEEHTSELQSLAYLVCRLLLEKKKHKKNQITTTIKITPIPQETSVNVDL